MTLVGAHHDVHGDVHGCPWGALGRFELPMPGFRVGLLVSRFQLVSIWKRNLEPDQFMAQTTGLVPKLVSPMAWDHAVPK